MTQVEHKSQTPNQQNGDKYGCRQASAMCALFSSRESGGIGQHTLPSFIGRPRSAGRPGEIIGRWLMYLVRLEMLEDTLPGALERGEILLILAAVIAVQILYQRVGLPWMRCAARQETFCLLVSPGWPGGLALVCHRRSPP